jgi:hypothetical protein
MSHTCHAIGCPVEVLPKLWGCPRHWFMIPRSIRRMVLQAYREGQENDKRPTWRYLFWFFGAQIAVAKKEGKTGPEIDQAIAARKRCQEAIDSGLGNAQVDLMAGSRVLQEAP